MINHQVSKDDPIFFGDDLHQILFNTFWVFPVGQLQQP
jgi:hypothetical protein